MSTPDYDVIIIGAGAAGLMCAAQAGGRGRKVLLLDSANKVGEKIRISGGGRCNFTNMYCDDENFISQNPHFAKSALSRFSPYDFVDLVTQADIAYHEKTLGQLFCDESANQIVAMLVEHCNQGKVEIRTQTEIDEITQTETGFTLTNAEQTLTCKSLVIATGGPSIPKMGASGYGYKIAEQFGLDIVPPVPGLVPLTLSDRLKQDVEHLSGVSLEVIATCNNTSFREAMLFTHRGLSGPAILQISSYWQQGQSIFIDLLPDDDLFALLTAARQNNGKQQLHTLLATILPDRLVEYLIENLIDNIRLGDLSDAKCTDLHNQIKIWEITPQGSEGFRTAEVAVGGVSTNELSAKTFEAKKVPGLYFIGEVVDVTGHLGGHNFQWAWASGHACGQIV